MVTNARAEHHKQPLCLETTFSESPASQDSLVVWKKEKREKSSLP